MTTISIGSFLRKSFSPLLFLTLVSCGGDSPDNASNNGDPSVTKTLNNLGVDTHSTPRLDSENKALPEDYTPLGSSASFEKFDELIVLGFPLSQASGHTNSTLSLLELDRTGSTASYVTDVLFKPEATTTPWATSSGVTPTALRAAARGDFDRDGLEELFVVYRAPDDSNITLQIFEDQPQDFSPNEMLIISTDPADRLSIATGDFNADGYTEAVIGIVSGDSARLIFVDNHFGTLSLSTLSKDLPQAFPGSEINLIIETGNLDYDPSHEIVLIVNELFQQAGTGNPATGTSRYFIIDDAKKSFTDIDNNLVQANLSNINLTAVVADVSLGDVDGDNIDEIVFAGLTHFDSSNECNYKYLIIALDDMTNNQTPITAKEQRPHIFNGCSTAKGELQFVHVNTIDINGDSVFEIQANEFIFSDLKQSTTLSQFYAVQNNTLPSGEIEKAQLPITIPHDRLFAGSEYDITAPDNTGFTGNFSQTNSSMAVADLTSDKRQDIIFYSQATNSLEVWGLSEPDSDIDNGVFANEWRMLKSIPVEPTSTDDLRPVLLPINTNHDGLSISYDVGEYQLVFTEPVIIAALAAAPCYANQGQNLDACRTSLSNSESQSAGIDNSVSISVGVTAGLNFEATEPLTAQRITEASILATLKASLSLSHSSSYTYTESVTYTTGPIEDTVVFTSIPYDTYTYTITTAPADQLDIIGQKITIAMPRTPITLHASRDFYNNNVTHGGPLINDSVFTHTPGDPDSYLSKAEKDIILSNYSTIDITNLLNISQWAFEIGPEPVGATAGSQTQEIDFATQTGFETGIGLSYEIDNLITTGPIALGFSVGISTDHSLSISHGSASTYNGTVSDLPPEIFASHGYQWGLFTYVLNDHPSGQQFEVINYWVE